ncbi:hypothetical protein PHISCL_06213 [Aspergillus sclerotialis]|uniref:Uncharacterized protein n=1 Tax=Aspergillus sclerotialis TaxID=2070753 RepID=A0A3A2ZE87_9EURO|nr:hypothetical protein PHISCL_06213 [Aspergillus sclerotialis]
MSATQPDFTDPSFDPADFLNDTLPPLTLASSQSHSRPPGSASLPDLSAQVQSLLSQVNAQNVRLSNNLTQLTDEILRSGGRLAYEVEVLRGETIGLRDTLTEGLQHDISKFVPDGLDISGKNQDTTKSPTEAPLSEDQVEDEAKLKGKVKATLEDPEYIKKLRTLNQVRSRLEDVVHTFGEAMEWPLPPSEVSLTSSFISVAAPEPGSESQSREEKGQEVAKKLRTEVTELLDSEGGGMAGVEAASRRVEAVRVLATVWRGSAEEKARNRLVDSLAKIVEDRRKALDSQAMADSRSQSAKRSSIDQRRDSDSGGPGGGIFKNLQRLREEIYLE